MLILGAVGLQIRLSDIVQCSARPLVACKARMYNLFSCKDTTNGTVQYDFSFVSFLFVR